MMLNKNESEKEDNHRILTILRQMKNNKIRNFLRRCHTKDNLQEKLREAGFTLTWAATLGNVELLKLLLDHDCHAVDDRDPFNGHTALHIAVKNDNFEMVKVLVDYGADVDAFDKSNSTPLRYLNSSSVRHDNSDQFLEMLILLLSRATWLTPCSYLGTMQIRIALVYGSTEVVKLVLKRIDNLYVTDSFGNTVVHYLMNNRQADIVVEALRGRNFDVNARNNDGETPLHLAVKSRMPHAVAMLLEKGANFRARDSSYYTPMHRLFQFLDANSDSDDSKKCIQLLLDHGWDPFLVDVSIIFDFVSRIRGKHRIASPEKERIVQTVMETMLAYLAVRKTRGIGISEPCLFEITRQPSWIEYLKVCEQQLVPMKKTMIYGKVTLFDFLTESENKIIAHVRNEELVSELERVIETLDVNSPYPDKLRDRLVNAKKLAELREKAVDAVCRIAGSENNAFYFAAEHIVDYLSNEDKTNVQCALSE